MFPLIADAARSAGVICVGVTSVIQTVAAMAAMLAAASVLVWFTFRLDETFDRRLFPSRVMWPFTAVRTA